MKKSTYIFLTLMLFFAAVSPRLFSYSEKAAYAADPEYAKVISNNVMLYRNNAPAAEEDNYFLLPENYYVFLEDVTGEEYYKVKYDTFTGYVKAEDVDIVSYTPKLKYASGQLLKVETPDGGSCNLREFPNKTSAKVIENGIPDETTDIQFYNYVIVGEDRWYFIKYEGKAGYIFGEYAVITTEIAVNDGAAEPVVIPPGDNDGTIPQPLDLTTVIILAAVIGIPAIAILIMLFRPRRRRPRYSAPPPREEPRRIPRYLDEEEQPPRNY